MSNDSLRYGDIWILFKHKIKFVIFRFSPTFAQHILQLGRRQATPKRSDQNMQKPCFWHLIYLSSRSHCNYHIYDRFMGSIKNNKHIELRKQLVITCTYSSEDQFTCLPQALSGSKKKNRWNGYQGGTRYPLISTVPQKSSAKFEWRQRFPFFVRL